MSRPRPALSAVLRRTRRAAESQVLRVVYLPPKLDDELTRLSEKLRTRRDVLMRRALNLGMKLAKKAA